MATKLNVQQVKGGYEIELSGDDELAKVDAEKIQSFLVTRLACAARNRCADETRSVAERLNCVSTLADRRIAKIGRTDLARQTTIDVKKSANGLRVSITGPGVGAFEKAFQASQLEEGLTAIRACRQANRCGTKDQTLSQRWQCVGQLGARRFANV